MPLTEYSATSNAVQASAQSSTPEAAEHVVLMPIAALRESPHNPRRSYSDAALEELADSISTQGILQPIVVRPIDQTDIDSICTHEVVFGHRRLRAARGAGLDTVPAIVRDMSDRDARIAQHAENLHRQDVHYIEEADSLAELIASGMSADAIAADLGKSRSYVYGRAKLATLTEPARIAALDRGLPAEIALMIARFPAPLQATALRRAESTHGVWHSARAAKVVLSSLVTPLDSAPWSLSDSKLLDHTRYPPPACNACHRNSLLDRSLTELEEPMCMDRTCWDRKQAARLAQLEAAKPPRVDTRTADPLTEHDEDAPPATTLATLATGSAPSTAARALTEEAPAAQGAGESTKDGDDQLTALECLLLSDEDLLRRMRLAIARRIVERPRTRADMVYLTCGRLTGEPTAEEREWLAVVDPDLRASATRDELIERMSTLWSADQLGEALMIDAILTDVHFGPLRIATTASASHCRSYTSRRIEAAQRWGVDVQSLIDDGDSEVPA